MFIVDGQLFVGFETFARISEDAFPELAGEREVAFALGEARERAARGTIGFGWQFGGERLRIVLSGASGFAAAFADARNAEEFEAIGRVRGIPDRLEAR